VDQHAASSIFHTPAWLEALHRTYGYEPVVYTTSAPGTAVTNGVVVCRVKSWLTGRRLVSVPFADCCEPIADSGEDQEILLQAVNAAGTAVEWRYAELRLRTDGPAHRAARTMPWHESSSYDFHELDLRPSLEQLYKAAHRSTIQRKIERAEREGLSQRLGRSEALIEAFYRLLVLTRRRHGIPPQPIQWFRNLVEACGTNVTIRVAYQKDRPVASILTLRHRDTLVYKYGCSDNRFHNLGTMPWLFWLAIRDAKSEALVKLDLGRSDWNNTGLRTFKQRWGAASSGLSYVRPGIKGNNRKSGLLHRLHCPAPVMYCVPDWALQAAGKFLYRHIA
jgi:hypothetical protein